MPTFERLTRSAMRSLAAGERISEHGIVYEKLKNGDGKFLIELRIDGQRIHRTIGKESEGATRNDAESVIERLKTESREGRLKLPKGRKTEMSFKEAADKYIERLKLIGGKDIRAKEDHLKLHLKPFFGSKALSAVNSFDVERYKKHRLDKSASAGTINRELAALSHLYNCAKDWGWIDGRPFELKKLKDEAKRITYLTPEQCDRLLNAARAIDAQLYLFIRIGLATGMRMSEILSTEISNIDLTRRQIFIPKAKAGARYQPITATIAEYLDFYIKNSCATGQKWLFPSTKSPTGHRKNLTKVFRQAVKKAGLDEKTVIRHTLRHTAVSLLVQSGVDLPTVMSISGHKTTRMVERYSHRDGAHIQAAMDKLDQKLNEGKVMRLKEA